MGVEIERKFLITDQNDIEDVKLKSHLVVDIEQGYLSKDPERTTRIRVQRSHVTGNHAYLTVKGKSSEDGLERIEVETEIPFRRGVELLKMCIPGVIKKTRYFVEYGDGTWEVDEFQNKMRLGDDVVQDLVLAEIELVSADQQITLPQWVGDEVTGNSKYYNSNMEGYNDD